MREIYHAATIINPQADLSCNVIEDGALVVENGLITSVGKYNDLDDKTNTIELGQNIIMPGMVDTHVHLPQYPIIARYGYTLLEWLNKFTFPAERQFTPERASALAPVFFRELKRNGTTTAAVYSTVNKESTDIAFQEAEKAGIRAIIGKVMMNQNSPDYLIETTDNSLQDSIDLCQKWNGQANGKLMFAFTPRFAPTCSKELMEKTAIAAKQYGAYIQTHLSENEGEIEWVKQLFPWAANYTDVYDNVGLLGPKTILGHGIYLSPQELQVLEERGCSIAHCPVSNLDLQSGLFPMGEVHDAGVPIGLATDVGGGHNISMFRVMEKAIDMQTALSFSEPKKAKKITPENAISMATLGGAKALGLDRQIGNFEQGKKADFVVMNMGRVISENSAAGLGLAKGKDLLSQIVFQADDRVIDRTVVDGVTVYQYQEPGS
jgi:guanine deaminase